MPLDQTLIEELGDRALEHWIALQVGERAIGDEPLDQVLWRRDEPTDPVLQGFGHLARYSTVRDGSPFEGITLRLFDPATGEWSIHWADTARARTLLPPMVGRFIGGVGEFYGDETVDGKKVLCRFL